VTFGMVSGNRFSFSIYNVGHSIFCCHTQMQWCAKMAKDSQHLVERFNRFCFSAYTTAFMFA